MKRKEPPNGLENPAVVLKVGVCRSHIGKWSNRV